MGRKFTSVIKTKYYTVKYDPKPLYDIDPLVCTFCGKSVYTGYYVLAKNPDADGVITWEMYSEEYLRIEKIRNHVYYTIFGSMQRNRVPDFVKHSCEDCLRARLEVIKQFRDIADLDIAVKRFRTTITKADKEIKKEMSYEEENNHYW